MSEPEKQPRLATMSFKVTPDTLGNISVDMKFVRGSEDRILGILQFIQNF